MQKPRIKIRRTQFVGCLAYSSVVKMEADIPSKQW
jgi:hypothetical protein